MTLTVPEVARRLGRNPETVRRWIREGRLRANRVEGLQALGLGQGLLVPDRRRVQRCHR